MSEKLTKAQRRALETLSMLSPVGGNEAGWIMAFHTPGVSRPTIRTLVRGGFLEPHIAGYIGPTGGLMHRITPAGRAALHGGGDG